MAPAPHSLRSSGRGGAAATRTGSSTVRATTTGRECIFRITHLPAFGADYARRPEPRLTSIRPGGVLEVELGGDAVAPFVLADAAGDPQAAVGRGGEHRLAQRALGLAKGDRLDPAAVVARD